MSEKNYCTFYIVRHGETQWNVDNIIQGHSDIPLNTNGEAQIKLLGEKMKDIHFDFAFSSDLMRAKKTAEIITLERKLAVQTTQLLRERNFGFLEGKPSAELNSFWELMRSLSDTERFSYKSHQGLESDEEICIRVLTFLRETAVLYPGKTILVVTHGGVMRTLLFHLGYNYKRFIGGGINNAAFIKLETDGVDFFVKEMQGIQVTSE